MEEALFGVGERGETAGVFGGITFTATDGTAFEVDGSGKDEDPGLPGSGGESGHGRSGGLAEEAALTGGDGQTDLFHDGEHVFPDASFVEGRLGAEEVGGMERGHEGNAVEIEPFPADLGDEAGGMAEQTLDGGGAEGDEYRRSDDIDLSLEVGQAGCHFSVGGFPIAGDLAWGIGTAFEDVGDVDLIPTEFHGGEDAGEEFPGGTDEGFAEVILVGAGGFADEQDLGLRIAGSEHDVFPGGGQCGASGAGECAGLEGGEGSDALVRSEGWSGEQGWVWRRRQGGGFCADGGGDGTGGCDRFRRRGPGCRGGVECGEVFGSDRDMGDAQVFQAFQMEDGCIEQPTVRLAGHCGRSLVGGCREVETVLG